MLRNEDWLQASTSPVVGTRKPLNVFCAAAFCHETHDQAIDEVLDGQASCTSRQRIKNKRQDLQGRALFHSTKMSAISSLLKPPTVRSTSYASLMSCMSPYSMPLCTIFTKLPAPPGPTYMTHGPSST